MDKIIYESCDIGDMSSVREFAKRVKERFNGINLLINNGKYLIILISRESSLTVKLMQ